MDKIGEKWIRRLAVATLTAYIGKRGIDLRICLQLLDEVMKEDKDEGSSTASTAT
jgi:hypothetical protein